MNKEKFFKYDTEGRYANANDVYDAYYDSTIYTMYFKSEYWFRRELLGIEMLKNKPYAPQITEVDEEQRLVSLEYEDNLNHMIHFNRLPKNYKQKILEIKKDLEDNGIYKLNFYPHTFFYKNEDFFLIDNYAMAHGEEKILKADIESTIHDKERFPFVGNYLDIVKSYNIAIQKNVGNWPENFICG